jgi:L-rhamnose mutarotase
MVIELKPQHLEEYKQLHANPWPEVLEQLDRSHVRNFSIWLVEAQPDKHLLFAYFEYDGKDFDADMAAMAKDNGTQRWWKLTDPMQTPISTARPDEHWVMMREVFYHDRNQPNSTLMPAPRGTDVGNAK